MEDEELLNEFTDSPVYPYSCNMTTYPGMTLREHFAVQAMTGLLTLEYMRYRREDLATMSVKCADELIKALHENKKGT